MKIVSVFTALSLALALSACTVSDSEREACESAGNSVETREFETQKRGERFWQGAIESGPLSFCSSPQGHILTVYNDVVTEPRRGIFGDGADNIYIFEQCEEIGGVTYSTERDTGDSTETSFACLQDGRVVSFERRS